MFSKDKTDLQYVANQFCLYYVLDKQNLKHLQTLGDTSCKNYLNKNKEILTIFMFKY